MSPVCQGGPCSASCIHVPAHTTPATSSCCCRETAALFHRHGHFQSYCIPCDGDHCTLTARPCQSYTHPCILMCPMLNVPRVLSRYCLYICMQEVNFLRGRDEGKNKIDFVDIADPSYDPADNAGISFELVRYSSRHRLALRMAECRQCVCHIGPFTTKCSRNKHASLLIMIGACAHFGQLVACGHFCNNYINTRQP